MITHVKLNSDLIPASLRPAAEAILLGHLPRPHTVEIHYEGAGIRRAVLHVPVWAFERIEDCRSHDPGDPEPCVEIGNPQLVRLEEELLGMLRANSVDPCS